LATSAVERLPGAGAGFEVAHEALFGLLYLQCHVVRPIDDALARAHDSSLTGYEVLGRLARMHPEGASVRYLSDQVVVSPSRVSRVVDELVSRGWLERAASPHDGRLSLVRLTPAGRDELEGMRATFAGALHSHFLDRLTADPVGELVAVARALGAPHC
jgi:DNA-binding MarR family transcriptional regulator